jgi:L-idonate 5-dehydrogenase
MKAIVIHKARDLRIEDRDLAQPGPGQVSVAIKRGGICGSDLHYYNHGGFGVITLKHPMVLGHEVAGVIDGLGAGVTALAIGQRVAVSPSRPCGVCVYCQKGQQNHCLDMRFYGSAMRNPHVHGAFQQTLVADVDQCHVVADGINLEEAAFAEPFAVTLHGMVRLGSLAGKRLLVTGCGPIGALAIAAARLHGAQEIVATDVSDFTLNLAEHIGADRGVNVARDPMGLADFKANKGYFDVMIEASGNEAALRSGLECLKPRGTLLQLGLGGDVSIPQNLIVSKEIEIRGSFRFHEEFALAVDLINRQRVSLKPLLSQVVPLHEAVKGFELASDRGKAMKVQIAFDT